MKENLLILIVIFTFSVCKSQNCLDRKLSQNFDFDVSLISKDKNDLGKAIIIIKIFDKRKAIQLQTIEMESEFILKSESFKNCENNKSFSSNEFLKSNENDFGDLILADVNFDGKEDIAVKREEGGNGGPLYNFYIQSENQKFILDKYLSTEMSYFPDYLDSKEKTLHIYIRKDNLTEEGITYSYSEKNQSWFVLNKRQYRNGR